MNTVVSYTIRWVDAQGANIVVFRRPWIEPVMPRRGDFISAPWLEPESFFYECVQGVTFDLEAHELVIEITEEFKSPFDPSDVSWYEANGWTLHEVDVYDSQLKESLKGKQTQ